MIKVAARQKFSRNTYGPIFIGQFNNKRSSSRNRSSIMMNDHSLRQSLDFQQRTQTEKSNANTKMAFLGQSLDNFNSHQSQPKSRRGKPAFIKPSQDCIPLQRKTQLFKKKFSKLSSQNSSFIKIEENEDKNSTKTIKTSSSNFKESGGSSAMKKFPKYQTSFSIRINTRKASIFHHNHSMTVTHEQEQYEEFLKQSNLNKLTKNIICQKVTQNDEDKQNEEMSERKSIFFTEDKASERPNKEKIHAQTEKENNLKKLLRKISSKTKKSSQKAIKIPNDKNRSYNQIFHSMTQTAFQESCDKEGQIERQVPKIQAQSRVHNEQEMILRKQESLKQAEQMRIQSEKIYKQQTEELFRHLERQIASKEEMDRFEKKSNNYYEELRQKLVEKYEKIQKDYRMDENDMDKIGLLIDGCNLQRHRRVNNFYFEKKQSSGGGRMDAAAIGQATKDINKLNFINKSRNKTIMRPQTSRSKSISKAKINNSLEKSSNMFSDYVSMKTQPNIYSKINQTYNKLSDSGTECIFNMTNPDIKSRGNLNFSSKERPKTAMPKGKNLRMTEFTEKEKHNIKEKTVLTNKFDALLGVCDEENYDCEDTKRKMKVFEYYCTKIDNGFEKISQRITDYVANM